MNTQDRKVQLNSESKSWIRKFLFIAVTFLIVTSIIAGTFAWYIDYKRESALLNLGKIELGANTTFTTTAPITNLIAGSPIVSNEISVSKKSDSEPIFIRAKLAFSVPPTASLTIQDYLEPIRENIEYNFNRINQNGATWSYKYNNYVYLVNTLDPSIMFSCTDTTLYNLTSLITLPQFLDQDDNGAQLGSSTNYINFNFAFEAIQSTNLDSYTFDDLVDLFDESFPPPVSETFVWDESTLDKAPSHRYLMNGNLNDSIGSAAFTGGSGTFSSGVYSIAGTTASTTLPDIATLHGKIFSISLWINMPSGTYTVFNDILSFGAMYTKTVPNVANTLRLEVNNSAGTSLNFYGNGFATESMGIGTSFIMGNGVMKHIAIISNGERFIAYLNGVKIASIRYSTDDWYLDGTFKLGQAGILSQIKDLRIYPSLLSVYQVTQIYNAG